LTSSTTNRLLLVSAAVLFSTGGAAIKSVSLSAWQVAGFRSGVAAVTLFALAPAARRAWTWRVVLVGGAYASMLVLFVTANKLTTSANAIFLQDTAPLYLLLIGPLLLGERIRRGDLLFLCVMALGMACFFLGEQRAVASAPNPALGNEIAALTGVAWAFTIAGLRWVGRSAGESNAATATVTAGNLIAFLVCLPAALPVKHIGAANAGIILYLGVFQIGVAYLFVTRAIRHVPAFTTATILLVEPALNPIWAWLVHGERPGPLAIAGGCLIIGATLANTWWQSRKSAVVESQFQPKGTQS
jgi:drug/metabolite transporter (DMT)-like permease